MVMRLASPKPPTNQPTRNRMIVSLLGSLTLTLALTLNINLSKSLGIDIHCMLSISIT